MIIIHLYDNIWEIEDLTDRLPCAVNEFKAEFCDNGDIKIRAWIFCNHNISDEDLALFYTYSREEISWIPLICNGRLL